MGGGASKRPPKRAVDSLDNPDHIQRPLWECGVELEYLIRLYAEMQTGIFSENPYFTTGDMVQQFILPKVQSKGQRCAPAKCRFQERGGLKSKKTSRGFEDSAPLQRVG